MRGLKVAGFGVKLENVTLDKRAGGVAVIQVGSATESEVKERKDRVDDAVNATRVASGLPAPERLEAAPMPANDGFRLDDDDRTQHAGPQPIQPDEKEPVGTTKPNPFPCATHDIELMSQG